jgi:uncharacterized membrane protein
MPERSYLFGGLQWPVCARCGGIYMGLVFALVALLLAYRGRQRTGSPVWPSWLFLALALAVLGYDGLSSYLGWRSTTNDLRLISGIVTGAAIAPLVYTMLVSSLAKESEPEPTLGGGVRPLLSYAGSMIVAGALVYAGGSLLGPVTALLVALCIVATFALLMLVLVGLFRRFERSVATWRDLLWPGALSLTSGLLMIVLIALLKAWLLSL